MNLKVMNLKWLAVILLMCAPTFAWAKVVTPLTLEDNTYAGTYAGEYGTATGDNLITVADGSASIAINTSYYDYYNTSNGAGWKNESYWNLSSYDIVRVTYSDLKIGSGGKVYLYVGDSTRGTAVELSADSENVDFVISKNTSGYGANWGDYGTIDYNQIEYILINATAASSVTIESVEFIQDSAELVIPDGAEVKDISEEDVTLGKTGGTYHITGDGTDGGYTILFPEGASGEYTIYLDNVTIDIANRTDDIAAALSIPEGVTVKLYVCGTCSISGSTYGIYAAASSNLDIEVESDENLTISADYGIWFDGDSFDIHSDDGHNQSYTYGTTTINAKYCGIYFGNSMTYCDIKGNDLVINISGGETERASDENAKVGAVCGIYNATTLQINISMGDLTITAPSDGTYGIYSNATSGNGVYFGFGTFTITATKCVLHHVDEYAGGYSFSENYANSNLYVTLQFNGPFCIHYKTPYQIDGAWHVDYWTCDGGTGTADMKSEDDDDPDIGDGSTGVKSDITYQIDDQYDYYGLSGAVESVTEIEYYDRKLNKGWNTISLPCSYDLSADSSVDEKYIGHEARDVIDKYAVFSSYSEETEGTDFEDYEFILTFEDTEKTDGSWTSSDILAAEKAYLIHVDDNVIGENDTIMVKFTSMNADLPLVSSDEGSILRTVYRSETLNADGTLTGYDGNSTGSQKDTHHYKLDRTKNDDGTVTNFFNQAVNSATIPHFRAYVDLDDLSQSVDVKSVGIMFDSGEVTSIDKLDGGDTCDENAKVNVYSLDGQLVKVAAAKVAANGLAKGVYIIDGKKVVVM